MLIKVLYAQHSPLHPNSVLDLLCGKQSSVPYREVATIYPEDLNATGAEDDAILGRVFTTMNCVEGDPDTEMCVRLKVRSMMVGDRVTIEDDSGRTRTYQCMAVGWKLLETAAAEEAAS